MSAFGDNREWLITRVRSRPFHPDHERTEAYVEDWNDWRDAASELVVDLAEADDRTYQQLKDLNGRLAGIEKSASQIATLFKVALAGVPVVAALVGIASHFVGG